VSHAVSFDSSCVSTGAFTRDSGVLHLQFRNGLTYEYSGVPEAVFEALLAAPSKGSFVARFIRGQYPYRRIGPDQL
jgi:hypothetical protein